MTKPVPLLRNRPWKRLSLRAAGRPTLRLIPRVAISLLRRRVRNFQTATVDLDERGTKILADLTRPLGLSLYRYGFHEPEAQLIRLLLNPGDAFIDGGANIGIFTLIGAASVTAKGRVIACEPVPETMGLLKANVALNNFHCVNTRLVALAQADGKAQLYSFGSGSGLSSFAPEFPQHGDLIPVEMVSLDELACPVLDTLKLVKLDIEGAEVRAMRGAERILSSKIDFLLEVEPEHLARQGTTVAELWGIFEAAGYAWYEIRMVSAVISLVRMTRWRRPSNSPNIFASPRALQDFPPDVNVDLDPWC